MEWTDVIGTVALIGLFLSTIIGLSQLRAIKRRNRFDTAPFVRFDIEASRNSIGPANPKEAVKIIPIDELSKWADINGPQHRYMTLRLENKQKYHSGAATEVSFRIVIQFPKHGTPNTMLRVPCPFKRQVWLEAGETYKIVFADLRGISAGTVDIDNIEYYDVDNNKYNRSYGFCHWELDNTGKERWSFVACGGHTWGRRRRYIGLLKGSLSIQQG